MLDDALELAEAGMSGAMERLQKDLARVRTGRANPSVFDDMKVDSYGTQVPLKQVATVTVSDARLLVVKPFDRNTIGAVEKSINNAGLGLNANNDGVVVRVPIPPLTEERRKQLVKQAKDHGEEARIAVRQTRREANDLLKSAEKDHDISEDELKRGLAKVQEFTDNWIKKIDTSVTSKESEIIDD
jgi:ribosome recycling factor